jgi:hypothetical protein
MINIQQEQQKQSIPQEKIIIHEETRQTSDNTKSITELEALLKQLQKDKKEGSSNNLYIDQLLKTIEDLKESKDDEKNEYKERIT